MKDEKKMSFSLIEKLTVENFRGFLEGKCNCVWAKRLTRSLYKRDCFSR